MDAKLKSTLSKIQQERTRGNAAKALKRAVDAVKKYPDAPEVYREGVDASIEAGESLQAIQLLKRAFAKVPDARADLVAVARERASATGDGAVAKFLIEDAARRRELRAARAVVEDFSDRTVRDLLQRTRMKRSSLTSAAHGGHSVDDEITTNMLSEVVLAARLGRADEAAGAAGEVLDAIPDAAAHLEPLLDDLAAAHAQSAPALLALARCLGADGRHPEMIERVLGAVRIDRALGPDASKLLRDVGGDDLSDAMERALVDVMLITGDHDRAVERLRAQLGEDEQSARLVADRVAPYVAENGDVTDLHLLLLDAAAAAGRGEQLRETLDHLDAEPGNRPRLLEWLRAGEKTNIFAPDVQMAYAHMLIADGQGEEAARVLMSMCVASHDDVPRAVAMLAEHRDAHPALAQLHDELAADAARSAPPHDEPAQAGAGGASPPEAAPAASGAPFEVFESAEFTMGSVGADASSGIEVEERASRVELGSGDSDGEFDIYDGANILGGNAGAGTAATAPRSSAYTGERRPLDNQHAGIVWEEEGNDSTPAEPDRPQPERPAADIEVVHEPVPTAPPPEDAAVAPAPAADTAGESPGAQAPVEEPTLEAAVAEEPVVEEPPTEAPVVEEPVVSESHVMNVADALYTSGASTFFHIDRDDDNADPKAEAGEAGQEEPVENTEIEAAVEEAGVETTPDEPAETVDDSGAAEGHPDGPGIVAGQPDEPPTFQERMRRFDEGELTDDEVTQLMEEAVEEGLMEELGRLVRDAAGSNGFAVRRALCEAEYELVQERPARALECLDGIRDAELTEDQRKAMWLKTVACQRMMRDVDAAHQTLLQVVELYPDCPEVERLARINYREYLHNQCADATVLEKVSSLDGDSQTEEQ